MNKLHLLSALVGMAVSAHAFALNTVGEKVVLRALDKVTATTKDFTVPVGDTLIYGSLNVVVKHCEKKPPEETPETYAFLQIYEKQDPVLGEKDKTEESKPAPKADPEPATAQNQTEGYNFDPDRLFSGWMFASSPALSSLEHPVYDIWVLDCLD